MTDINEIRVRRVGCADLPWSCACVSGEQLDALIAEVERLRSERSLLEQEARIRKNLCDGFAAEVDRLRGELATLIVQADEVVRDHAEHFREQERAAVVTFVRGARLDELADAIERGEHCREEER